MENEFQLQVARKKDIDSSIFEISGFFSMVAFFLYLTVRLIC